jgi:hypothetical protein
MPKRAAIQGWLGQADTQGRKAGQAMKHRNSHLLVGYWSRLRQGRAVPDQTDIDPRAIKRALPYIFILEASDPARPLYRLAGTSHCDRYGHELKGSSFLAHWEAQSRNALTAVLQQSMMAQQPVCIASLAGGEDSGLFEVETVIAPLTFGGREATRFVGISHLLGDHAALFGKAITFERLVSSTLVHEAGEPPFVDLPPPPPPAVTRSFWKAPHLRLVVNRDKTAVARKDVDPTIQRLMEALEIAPLPSSRAVS